MEKILIHKQNGKPIGKDGTSVWVSKAVNERLEALTLESGISKQRIVDYLLRKALEVTEVVESEI